MLAEKSDTNAFLIEAAKNGGTAEVTLALRNGADPDIVIDADGAKNVLFEPFLYKNDHFTKTGSGQT